MNKKITLSFLSFVLYVTWLFGNKKQKQFLKINHVCFSFLDEFFILTMSEPRSFSLLMNNNNNDDDDDDNNNNNPMFVIHLFSLFLK